MENIQNARGKGYCLMYIFMFLLFFFLFCLMLCNRGDMIDFPK